MSKIISIELFAKIENNPALLEDPKANAFVDMANDWVESYIGTVYGEIKTKTKQFDLERVIFLEPNINEIQSLKVNGIEAPYKLNKSTGRVLLNSAGNRYDVVEITYTVGVLEVPPALQTATLQLAKEMFAKPDDFVASESIGGYSISYRDKSQTSEALSSLSDNMGIFNHYKARKI